ncbi:hypothetical protein RM555_00240 [Micromonospora sp. DSM 115977]|uniref:ATP-grasp domain-containing protein n=1 Tax=Micromonospora reichwaldensis TaxID=3075516 RepID=A0ABU2WND6_9ACTN|nr:hypothetical protein [Micromonospora sp. DSM 115977]MDT0527415.1 hypothetical protein [Micromonospora sp. DSM 115977]
MRHASQVCVVVDGYSTANALAPALAGYGLGAVHVQSDPDLPQFLLRTGVDHAYLDTYLHDGDVSTIVDRLDRAGLRPRSVVAGAETGVELGDQLARALGVPGNDPATTRCRRDKHHMARAAAAGGVAVIPHLSTASRDEAAEWLRAGGWLGDAVVKPRASSGSFGFLRCRSEADLDTAFKSWLGAPDVFGDPIGELLVQPFMTGDEYAVNTVSAGGGYVVSDIWHTRKRHEGGTALYDLERLVDPRDAVFEQLHGFVGTVLDALDIREGTAHTEVMMIAGEPVLVETGARFMGSIDISQLTEATGTNAVQLVAETIVAPDRFAARVREGWRPVLRRHAAMVQLLSRHSGTLAGYDLPLLRGLPSFHTVDTYLETGDPLQVTVNSYTTPGLVFLVHESPETISDDYRQLRELEAAGALFLSA